VSDFQQSKVDYANEQWHIKLEACVQVTLNNSSHLTCQTVDHTNTTTGCCQNHPLITEEDYYNFD